MSWIIFLTIVVTLIVLDLGLFNKKEEAMSLKQSLTLSSFYIIIALLFGVYVLYSMGPEHASNYYTGFLLEKAMSLDNIFVITIIFKFFQIPGKYQHRVLFWGILGVIILRAIMISAGAAILAKFEWVLFIFAVILILTGVKTLYFAHDSEMNIEDMRAYKWLRSKLNIYPKIVGNKFIIKENNIYYITPLFLALIIIEFMDLIFAIDSIPAIFAITKNSFIVYTSNIFAILGLRALFFCLADIVKRFHYLKYSLAIILILIGIKIIVAHFVKVPAYIPLLVTVLLILAGIAASLFLKKEESEEKSA